MQSIDSLCSFMDPRIQNEHYICQKKRKEKNCLISFSAYNYYNTNNSLFHRPIKATVTF